MELLEEVHGIYTVQCSGVIYFKLVTAAHSFRRYTGETYWGCNEVLDCFESAVRLGKCHQCLIQVSAGSCSSIAVM